MTKPRFVILSARIPELAGEDSMRRIVKTFADEAAQDVRRRAADRQRIARSIKSKVEKDGRKWVGVIYTDWFVSLFHEFGTRKMRARPFLRPGVESVLGRVHGSFRPRGKA